MSQRELARRLGRHHDVISRFARQETNGVSYDLLEEICETLQCQPGDLIRVVPPDEQIQIWESEGAMRSITEARTPLANTSRSSPRSRGRAS